MEVVSVMAGVPVASVRSQSALQPIAGSPYIGHGDALAFGDGPTGAAMTFILIGLGSGGCSLSRPDAYARMDAADVTNSLAATGHGAGADRERSRLCAHRSL